MKAITKSEIINQIWNENMETFRKNDTAYIINSFIKIIREEIKKGEKVKIEGLGTFSSSIRKSYIGKNIVNGNIEEIPSTRTISFKPSKKLKDTGVEYDRKIL